MAENPEDAAFVAKLVQNYFAQLFRPDLSIKIIKIPRELTSHSESFQPVEALSPQYPNDFVSGIMTTKALETLRLLNTVRNLGIFGARGNKINEVCISSYHLGLDADGVCSIDHRFSRRAEQCPEHKSRHRSGNLWQEVRVVPRQRWQSKNLKGKVTIRTQPYRPAMAGRC